MNPNFLNGNDIIKLDEFRLKLDETEKHFSITVLEADTIKKEIKIRMEIRSLNDSVEKIDVDAEFRVGFFDFPMIDNTRLAHDQRCAVVMNDFHHLYVDVTVLYFPGSCASLKEKPYYQEIIENLLPHKRNLYTISGI